MANTPPIFSPIPVWWVDPLKEEMAACDEAQDEARVEDSWKIQTDSDWDKLLGKKLGIQRADGSYLRGWLQDSPRLARGSALLRESNQSGEEVEILLEKIIRVDIIERRFPPLLKFKTPNERLSLFNSQVAVELTSGERLEGRTEISRGTDPDLILWSSKGERTSVPWENVVAMEARDELPSAPEKPPPVEKKKPVPRARKHISAPSEGLPQHRSFPKLLFRDGSDSLYICFSPNPSSEANRIVAAWKEGAHAILVDRDTAGRLVQIEIKQGTGTLGWRPSHSKEYLLKVFYQPQTDRLLAVLPLTKNDKADPVINGIALVYDLEGRLIGVEISEARKQVDLEVIGVRDKT